MNEHVRQLVDRFKHDRKLAIMAALLMVALLLWGRLLLPSSTPQTASADGSPAASARSGPDPATLPGPTVASPSSGRRVVEVALPEYLPRDLFNFPSADLAWAMPKKVEPEVKEEKSAPNPSDEQLRSATVRKAAAELQLRSVMMGDVPTAVINGRVLRPGQQIDGFTILAISERHVLLERQGIMVRLTM